MVLFFLKFNFFEKYWFFEEYWFWWVIYRMVRYVILSYSLILIMLFLKDGVE